MEHHSNIVPWQLLCEETGAHAARRADRRRGELILDEFERLLDAAHADRRDRRTCRTRSGRSTRSREIVALAHARGVPVLIDGAQAAYHMPRRRAGARLRLLRRPGHKLYGPTGIGVLYGKAALLEAMPPYQGGGDMISSRHVREDAPGTSLPVQVRGRHAEHRRARRAAARRSTTSQAIGLDGDRRARARAARVRHRRSSQAIPGVRHHRHGARTRPSVLSFVMDGVHPHDIGTILDREGVAVRTGHHCAQPVMDRFGIPATARASLAIYNTREELDALGRALRQGARGVRLMSDLSDLYQEVILDHNRRPRNFRALDGAEPPRRRATTRSAATGCTLYLQRRRRRRSPTWRSRDPAARSRRRPRR